MTNILERLDRLSDVIGGSVLGGPMLIADAKKEIVELRAAVVSEREACAKIADNLHVLYLPTDETGDKTDAMIADVLSTLSSRIRSRVR